MYRREEKVRRALASRVPVREGGDRGAPTLADIFSLLQEIARDSYALDEPALLIDLRDIDRPFSLAAQYLMGLEAGTHLSHLSRIAVVTNGQIEGAIRAAAFVRSRR